MLVFTFIHPVLIESLSHVISQQVRRQEVWFECEMSVAGSMFKPSPKTSGSAVLEGCENLSGWILAGGSRPLGADLGIG